MRFESICQTMANSLPVFTPMEQSLSSCYDKYQAASESRRKHIAPKTVNEEQDNETKFYNKFIDACKLSIVQNNLLFVTEMNSHFASVTDNKTNFFIKPPQIDWHKSPMHIIVTNATWNISTEFKNIVYIFLCINGQTHTVFSEVRDTDFEVTQTLTGHIFDCIMNLPSNKSFQLTLVDAQDFIWLNSNRHFIWHHNFEEKGGVLPAGDFEL